MAADIWMNIKGAWQVTEAGGNEIIRNQIPALVVLILVILVSVATIFLYKRRKLQIKLCLAVIVLIISFIGVLLFYALSVINKYQASPVPGWKMLIPLMMIFFGILAYRGIKKDEELVKSYDRLR